MRRREFVLFGLGIALALLPLVVANQYYLRVFILAGINTLVVVGLNLLIGFTGQISFGHNAFFLLGAYGSAILTADHGWNGWLALLTALALNLGAAALIGYPLLRLRGYYLALGTLGFALIVENVLVELADLTGGYNGKGGIPPLSLVGLPLETENRYLFLTAAAVLLAAWVAFNLIDSRVGRAMVAVRDNPNAAAGMGIDLHRTKLTIFVLTAGFASVGGSLHAHYTRFITVDTFGFVYAVELVTMLVIGGMGHPWGALVGAPVISLLPEYLQTFERYNILVFGILLIVILLFLPQGLASLPARLARSSASRSAVALESSREEDAALFGRTDGKVGAALLEVAGATKSFGGLQAVKHLTFTVRRGQIKAIIGPNGAGKTTVLNLVTGFVPLNGGEIRFGGRPLHGLPPHRVTRRGVARTFQGAQLFSTMTVLDNVKVGFHTQSRAGAWASMLRAPWAWREDTEIGKRAAGLLRLVGLENRAGELAHNLPLGQQRLLEVIRAVACSPDLLILDEPTAGLDRAETNQLAELIRLVKTRGVTILLVEHNMPLVTALSDEVLVLHHGEKIADGPPAEIQRDRLVIEAYLGREIEGALPRQR